MEQEREPLSIEPRVSPRLFWFVSLSHLAAMAVLLPLPITLSLKALLMLLALAGLCWNLWSVVLRRAPWSLVRAEWDDQGWWLETRSGRVFEARLQPSTYVGVRLVSLNFRVGRWRPCSLVLTQDNLGPESLRHLRAQLRDQAFDRQPKRSLKSSILSPLLASLSRRS